MGRSIVTALVVVTAGLAARAAVRHLTRRRAAVVPAAPVARPAPVPAPVADAVVLPFPRRAPAAPATPATPARCGDSGGRTKAGAPCGARATSAGRCHHHRIAA